MCTEIPLLRLPYQSARTPRHNSYDYLKFTQDGGLDIPILTTQDLNRILCRQRDVSTCINMRVLVSQANLRLLFDSTGCGAHCLDLDNCLKPGPVSVFGSLSLSSSLCQRTDLTELSHTSEDSSFIGDSATGCQLVWQKGKMLGKGSYGTVFLGMSCIRMAKALSPGSLLAVKVVEFATGDVAKTTLRELEMLKDFNHPNIVTFFGFDRTRRGVNLYIEYIPGGSLCDLLQSMGAFNEQVVIGMVQQILRGLAYLHGQGVVHRDLKTANILVTNGAVAKLADFGTAVLAENTANTNGLCGTLEWLAPELFQGIPPSFASDVWSFGCCIIEMATARSPWAHIKKGLEHINLLFRIGQQKAPPPTPDTLDTVGQDFFSCCMCMNPAQRQSCSQLLQHAWLDTIPDPAEFSDDAGSRTSSAGSSWSSESQGNQSSDGQVSETASVQSGGSSQSARQRRYKKRHRVVMLKKNKKNPMMRKLLPEKVKHELNAHRRQQRANVAASGFTPELLGQSPPGPAI